MGPRSAKRCQKTLTPTARKMCLPASTCSRFVHLHLCNLCSCRIVQQIYKAISAKSRRFLRNQMEEASVTLDSSICSNEFRATKTSCTPLLNFCLGVGRRSEAQLDSMNLDHHPSLEPARNPDAVRAPPGTIPQKKNISHKNSD